MGVADRDKNHQQNKLEDDVDCQKNQTANNQFLMYRRSLLISLLILLPTFAWAKNLVLVQGYLANPEIWEQAGIEQQLRENGWKDGGDWVYASEGVRLLQASSGVTTSTQLNRYFRVSLPSEASVRHQGYFLAAYLKALEQRYPDEPIVLVGHSAGGGVARYVMVRNPELKIDTLITIASPHLGTESAEWGKQVGDSPLAVFAPLMGMGVLTRSQGLYEDLMPEMPGRFLYWLNREPHPQAFYYSIVRKPDSLNGGDFVVPAASQHLENVLNLQYRAHSYRVEGNHFLNPEDGRLLLDLITETAYPLTISELSAYAD